MANWTQLRARLADLEGAVERGNTAEMLRAAGHVAVQAAELVATASQARQTDRGQGDIMGGDAYRRADVILDKLNALPAPATAVEFGFDPQWIRMLLEMLLALLKK